MTTNSEPPEDQESTQEPQEAPVGDDQQATSEEPQQPAQDDQDNDPEPANAEAARYRVRAREAEAERDQLREQITALQTGAAEAIAEQSGIRRPQALWAAGTELADLLDESGTVDADKVKEASRAAAERLGLSRAPKPSPASHGGDDQHRGASWSQALSPRS